MDKDLPNLAQISGDLLADLLDQLPAGTTIRHTPYLFDDEDKPKLRWEVKHEALSFSIIRNDLAQAARDFLRAIEKRGLRPLLEAEGNSVL